MGTGTGQYADGSIARAEQDRIAAASHERAADATKNGRLADEIIPVEVPQRRGARHRFEDEDGADTTEQSLAARGAFGGEGTVTAGNAQISDGVSSGDDVTAAADRGWSRLQSMSRTEWQAPTTLAPLQPANAIRAALAKTDLSLDDISLFELNEAFAAVGIASMNDLGVSDEIVNVNGGAIAVGHPIGMSGNRLALTLAHELRRRGGGMERPHSVVVVARATRSSSKSDET